MADRDIFMTEYDRQRIEDVLAQREHGAGQDSDGTAEILRRCIGRARILPAEEMPHDVVTMRSIVRLRNVSTGRQRAVSLTFPDESEASEGRMSILSRAGVALLGCHAGDRVQWGDGGDAEEYELLDIIYQPEAAGHFDL